MARGVLLTSNLPQLQNLIKRDPVAYKEEFIQQWNHYNSVRRIFQINPDEQAHHFKELVSFISQVCQTSPCNSIVWPIFDTGCVLLPERDSRLSDSPFVPTTGTLRSTFCWYSAYLGPEPCPSPKEECHCIDRVCLIRVFFTLPLIFILQAAQNALPSSSPHDIFVPSYFHTQDNFEWYQNSQPALEEPQAQQSCPSDAFWYARAWDGRWSYWWQGQGKSSNHTERSCYQSK